MKWLSDIPKQCDMCKGAIFNIFVDGKVMNGGWAILCPNCHAEFGNGLGTGLGQMYERRENEFIKVAG